MYIYIDIIASFIHISMDVPSYWELAKLSKKEKKRYSSSWRSCVAAILGLGELRNVDCTKELLENRLLFAHRFDWLVSHHPWFDDRDVIHYGMPLNESTKRLSIIREEFRNVIIATANGVSRLPYLSYSDMDKLLMACMNDWTNFFSSFSPYLVVDFYCRYEMFYLVAKLSDRFGFERFRDVDKNLPLFSQLVCQLFQLN